MKTRRIDPSQATEEFHSPALRRGLSSMVDLGFLLLIYFLVVSTIQPVEADLDMRTADERGTQIEMYPLDLLLQKDGSVVYDDQKLEMAGTDEKMPNLRRELANIENISLSFGAQPHIVIELEDGAAHQRFASILDALQEANITQFSLRAGSK